MLQKAVTPEYVATEAHLLGEVSGHLELKAEGEERQVVAISLEAARRGSNPLFLTALNLQPQPFPDFTLEDAVG